MAQAASNEQIVEAALAVIVRRGYAGATTREIAAEAGINEVTLFRRYGSKAKVLQAVLAEEAARFANAGIAHTGNLEADLYAIVAFYLGLMEHRGSVILSLAGEIARNRELLDMMETPLGVFRQVASILAQYQHEGLLVEEPPDQALSALLGPLFLGAMLGHMAQRSVALGDAKSIVHSFLDGRRERHT